MKSFFILMIFLVYSEGTSIFSLEKSGACHEVVQLSANEFENDFYVEYAKSRSTNHSTTQFKKMVELIKTKTEEKKIELTDIPNSKNPQECLLCRATTFTILKYNKDNEEIGSLKNIAKNLCSIFEIVPEDVCEGMVDVNAPTIKYIIKENPNILSETFCGIFMQADDCGPDSTIFDISFELPTEQIPRKMNQEMDTPIRAPANYTILHITDIHLDPFYEAGGNAVCGRGACCRKNQGKPSNESSAAGKWGDYRDCDTPWEAVVDLVQQIKRQHKKIDIIYYTGDIVDHFSWEITKQGNTDSIKKVFKLFRDNFQNIPIFPVLGNHEAYPSNVFAPTTVTSPEVSIKWLYDLANEEWESWLPSTTKKTIQEGGYYTVLVNPGFRIVALNNNICYHSNWWILHDTLYFTEQLQWLHDVLMAASLDSEIVHILGHVPSNDPYCYKGWTKSYRAIVNKFQNVIASQFNGHSHVDEFNLYYSEDNTTPISTAWNGASATTFAYLNPNYRVYYADSETHEILDFETWIYNLTEANLTPDQNPRWFKEYSFKEEYGLKDLSPKSIDGLVKRFATDRELLFKYWTLKIKQADTQLQQGCDEKCLKDHLCAIVTTVHGDNFKCDELYNLFQ